MNGPTFLFLLPTLRLNVVLLTTPSLRQKKQTRQCVCVWGGGDKGRGYIEGLGQKKKASTPLILA